MRRRTLLATLPAAVAAVAGCMGADPEPGREAADAPDDEPATTRTTATTRRTDTATTEPTARTTTARPPMESKTVRARGAPVETSKTVTDRPGWEDNTKYFPANGTVRVALARGGGGVVQAETVPFEEWAATFEAPEAAMNRARSVTAERLGTTAFGSAISAPPDSVDAPLVATIRVTYDNEDGRLVEPPEIPLADLADAAPRSVDVTVTMGERSHTSTVPVFVAREPEAEPIDLSPP